MTLPQFKICQVSFKMSYIKNAASIVKNTAIVVNILKKEGIANTSDIKRQIYKKLAGSYFDIVPDLPKVLNVSLKLGLLKRRGNYYLVKKEPQNWINIAKNAEKLAGRM